MSPLRLKKFEEGDQAGAKLKPQRHTGVRVVAREVEMTDKYEQCLQLRDQVASYIGRFLQKRGITLDTEYQEGAVKMCYRPDDAKIRSLSIVAYWEQGFYVWVV